MHYLGGKFRVGKQIAGYLNLVRKPGQAYAEPFVGACWVTQYIHAPRRYAYDKHAGMIALWQALQDGWLPPGDVSEDEFYATKKGLHDDDIPLKTFILIGCGFGATGRGYARGDGHNYASQARRGLLQKLKRLRNVQFACTDFIDWQPPESRMLIYCDPPYVDRTEDYEFTGAFDNTAFWQRVRELSSAGHDVYVSEYRAPDDIISVLDIPTKTSLRTKAKGCETRVERLFSPRADAVILQPALL